MASGNTLPAFILTSLPKSNAVDKPVSSPAITPAALMRSIAAALDNTLAPSAATIPFLAPTAANVRSTFISVLALFSNLPPLNTAPRPLATVPTTPSLSAQSLKPPHSLSSCKATSCITIAACQSEISAPFCKSLYKPSNQIPFSLSGTALNATCK